MAPPSLLVQLSNVQNATWAFMTFPEMEIAPPNWEFSQFKKFVLLINNDSADDTLIALFWNFELAINDSDWQLNCTYFVACEQSN